MNYEYNREQRRYVRISPIHPHSHADIFEAMNPGEARVEPCYPPIPWRHDDWQASFYDGEPSTGGYTREDAAINALEFMEKWQ